HVFDQPLPEGQRLGVGIVDAERVNAVPDPEEHDVATRVPETLAVLAPEVQRIDVLILLRWVLRVLDRSVGTDVEPIRVLLHPGMIGRALQRIVERDLHAEALGGRDEAVEVVDRAELRMNRSVTAFGAADRPWAADRTRPPVRFVVASLA